MASHSKEQSFSLKRERTIGRFFSRLFSAKAFASGLVYAVLLLAGRRYATMATGFRDALTRTIRRDAGAFRNWRKRLRLKTYGGSQEHLSVQGR